MKKSRTFRKSFVAAIAALCLAAPLAVMPMTVSAEDSNTPTYSITVEATDNANHTYKAYQIFAGDLTITGNGDKILSNIEWGSGVVQNDLELEKLNGIFGLSGDGVLTDVSNASKIAELLTTANDATAKKFAKYIASCLSGSSSNLGANSSTTDNTKDYIVGGLSAGYYLVQDESTLDDVTNASKTAYILEVVGDVTATAKTGIPTVTKKVKENTTTGLKHNNLGIYADYNDVADYNIGDNVPFLLEATLPSSEFDEYDAYYLKFTDTLSKGFKKPELANIKVCVVKSDGTRIYVGDNIFNIHKDVSEIDITEGSATVKVPKLEVTIEDVRALKDTVGTEINVIASDKIVVEYTAELDTDAVIGQDGNLNEVYLEYSNNPNIDYSPTTDTAKNGVDSDNGIDEGGNPTDDNEIDAEEETTPESPDVPDDDNTPGVDEAEDNTGETEEDTVIVFTYELDITKTLSDNASLDKGKAGFVLKKDGKYAKFTNNVVSGWVDSIGDDCIVYNDEDDLVKFIGLDDGTYTLIEQVVPDGYNKMADDTITIDANAVYSQEWSGICDTAVALTEVNLKRGEEFIDGKEADDTNIDGVLNMTVVNKKGSSLPSTGGIGTTIFYLGGGTMAAVAGVYLITKKRMKNEEDDEI